VLPSCVDICECCVYLRPRRCRNAFIGRVLRRTVRENLVEERSFLLDDQRENVIVIRRSFELSSREALIIITNSSSIDFRPVFEFVEVVSQLFTEFVLR
jgi:hypothetical protein